MTGDKVQEEVRFVVVWSLRRGRLTTPEPLDNANQGRAYRAWRKEVCRQPRTEFETINGERVVWSAEWQRREEAARKRRDREEAKRVERMMLLAERARRSKAWA